jgi:hypothetical protein
VRGEEYDEEYRPFNRRTMYSVPAVERTDAEGDPDLPRYGKSRATTQLCKADGQVTHDRQPPSRLLSGLTTPSTLLDRVSQAQHRQHHCHTMHHLNTTGRSQHQLSPSPLSFPPYSANAILKI